MKFGQSIHDLHYIVYIVCMDTDTHKIVRGRWIQTKNYNSGWMDQKLFLIIKYKKYFGIVVLYNVVEYS